MAAKVTITMTPQQFDELRRGIKFAAEKEFELYNDERTSDEGSQSKWASHDVRHSQYRHLLDKVLV